MKEYQTTLNNASFQAPTRKPTGETYRPARPRLRFPCDVIEYLRLGRDPYLIEACMRHYMEEYEITPERGDLDAGTDLEEGGENV